MDFKKYWQQIKEDNKRMWSATKQFDRTYFLQIVMIFVVNMIGIFLITTMRENFPIQIFFVIFAVSACVIINIFVQTFRNNLKNNMPQIFAEESKKYGTVLQEFKCSLIFMGSLHFRGFYCKIYVYKKVVLVKFCERCLVINSEKYLKIEDTLIGYRCEIDKDGAYIQCRINKKQAEILKQQIEYMKEQHKYWNEE